MGAARPKTAGAGEERKGGDVADLVMAVADGEHRRRREHGEQLEEVTSAESGLGFVSDAEYPATVISEVPLGEEVLGDGADNCRRVGAEDEGNPEPFGP